MFVVLNISLPERGLEPDEVWLPVMPGENPHTYGSLESAAGQVVDLILEYGHTPESVPIYELKRVDPAISNPVIQKILTEEKRWVS